MAALTIISVDTDAMDATDMVWAILTHITMATVVVVAAAVVVDVYVEAAVYFEMYFDKFKSYLLLVS